MAESNAQVMEMIEAELRKDPNVSNADLFEKAAAIDPSIESLSARQFNARYPLQVKRALKPRKPKARRGKRSRAGTAGAAGRSRAGGADRDRVRGVLLELVKDIANAEQKGDVVDVVAGIDRYVDRVVKAGR